MVNTIIAPAVTSSKLFDRIEEQLQLMSAESKKSRARVESLCALVEQYCEAPKAQN